MQTKFDVLMCLTMLTLSIGLQSAETIQWLVEPYGALQLRQDWLNDRVNAVQRMRQIDEHERTSLACAVLFVLQLERLFVTSYPISYFWWICFAIFVTLAHESGLRILFLVVVT